MKKKYIISALIAAIMFAYVFAFLKLNIIFCILIGISAYYAIYLIIPSKKITIQNTKTTEELIEYTYMQLESVRSIIKEIENDKIKKNFKKACADIEKILKEISNKPSKAKDIKNFISYYLPVSIKILKQYDELENQGINSTDSNEFMLKVENMSEKIKQATENQLNSMYNKEIIDTNADIKVFETMLKTDGLLDNNFEIKIEDVKEG